MIVDIHSQNQKAVLSVDLERHAYIKARLEVVEREFREVRDRKARELAGAKRDATGAVAHAEMAAAGLYKRALHSNVSCWLALAVVGWRRHELARGMQKWQARLFSIRGFEMLNSA